jgi:hypothetical protein
MKELAREIKAMREIAGSPEAHLEELEVLRQRLANVRERLEAHNLMEEEQAYVWPSMLFDEQTSADLCDQLRHELENLPPRFA